MKLLRAFASPHLHAPSIVTLGNFDGVHLGHQALIQKTIDHAKVQGLCSVVATFEPQPGEFFSTTPYFRITQFREKLDQFKALGVDVCVVLPFNRSLSELSAEKFMNLFFKDFLHAQAIILGHDFRFGAQRQGDIHLLEKAGYDVFEIPAISQNGERISSTQIRQLLQAGDFTRVKAKLGRDYSVCGRVARGEQRGRLLGFPTANLFSRGRFGLNGVFKVLAKIDGTIYPAVANWGMRPTVNGQGMRLEVHLLDQTLDLYGRWMEVIFLKRLRGEQKFESLAALRAQITRDIEQAKE